MGYVLDDVREKVMLDLPEYDGRWSDDFLNSIIHMADCSVREECETLWSSVDIPMVAYRQWYALPEDVVSISSVQFYDSTASDADMTELVPVSFEDMDRMVLDWTQSESTKPSVYALWSAPGTSEYSRIFVWRHLSSVTGELVRVNYIASHASKSDLETATVPDWVQDAVYVPFVKAVLMRNEDPALAGEMMADYRRGMARVWEAYGRPRNERALSIGGCGEVH